MPKVYILILNYKKWQDAVECLESVFRLDYDNFTAIVVDNDSQNGSLEHLMEWCENGAVFSYPGSPVPEKMIERPIRYEYFRSSDLYTINSPAQFSSLVFVQNEKNNGFAGGNNTALRLLQNENAYIWLLNPDVVVAKNALSELIAFAASQPFKSVIGPVTKFYSKPEKVHLYGGGIIRYNTATVRLVDKISEAPAIDYISGGAMFLHASHFKEMGLLPEDYFLYWEETDWCYRAKKEGYQMRICTTAVCYDKISSTIGKGFLAEFYYTRNGLLFTSKYKKAKVPLVLFFSVTRILKKILLGQGERAKGVYKGLIAFLKRNGHEAK